MYIPDCVDRNVQDVGCRIFDEWRSQQNMACGQFSCYRDNEWAWGRQRWGLQEMCCN